MSRLNQPALGSTPRAEALLDIPGGPSAILTLGHLLWCVVDESGSFMRHGDTWTGTLGWSARVFEQLRFWELLHPDDVGAVAGFGQQYSARGPARFKTRVLSAYAAYLHVEWRADRLRGDRWLVVGHDVTDHVLAADRLREAQARYEALRDATFEAVVVHESGRITEANREACEMFGCSRRELLGRTVDDLVTPERRSSVAAGSGAAPFDEARAVVRRRDGRTLSVVMRAGPAAAGRCTQRVVVLRPT